MFDSHHDYFVAFLFYIGYPVLFILLAVGYAFLIRWTYKSRKKGNREITTTQIILLVTIPFVIFLVAKKIYSLDLYY